MRTFAKIFTIFSIFVKFFRVSAAHVLRPKFWAGQVFGGNFQKNRNTRREHGTSQSRQNQPVCWGFGFLEVDFRGRQWSVGLLKKPHFRVFPGVRQNPPQNPRLYGVFLEFLGFSFLAIFGQNCVLTKIAQ